MSQNTRAEFVAGLHALAEYLTANPHLPIPYRGSEVMVFVDGTDADQRAQIEHLASVLGVAVREDIHVTAGRSFGPIEYRAVAVLSAARARHDALWSYEGSVTPEPSSPMPSIEGGDA